MYPKRTHVQEQMSTDSSSKSSGQDAPKRGEWNRPRGNPSLKLGNVFANDDSEGRRIVP
jgi:hypothetical protein